MYYVHTFEIDYINSVMFAYENNYRSGRLDFEIQNKNSIKIIDFISGCNDSNFHQGTEMIIYLLNNMKFKINKIYGMLSTIDANSEYVKIGVNPNKLVGWHVSIPFYKNLTKYIPNSKFILYDEIMNWRKDITNEYENNPIKTINKLIAANNNCSFEIIINSAF